MAENHEIIVNDGKKEHKCFLREPDFALYGMALMAAEKDSGFDRIAAGKIVLEACWVSGDEIMKTDTKICVSASLEAYKLIDIYTAELKKK